MKILKHFRPLREFETITHRWLDNAETAEVLVGESASIVGWIPSYQEEGQLPNGYLKETWGMDGSVPLLLNSGNAAPPDAFSGPGEYIRYLNLRDFRGALCIDAPTLSVNRAGAPVELQFLALARVGSTSIRPLESITYAPAGISTACGDIVEKADRVIVRVFIRLKLGSLGQLAARLQTGAWPPWATLTIEYEFVLGPMPTARVKYSGTTIPSQTFYSDWRRTAEYRIETSLTEPGYQGFVHAGDCQDALAQERLTFTSWLRSTKIR